MLHPQHLFSLNHNIYPFYWYFFSPQPVHKSQYRPHHWRENIQVERPRVGCWKISKHQTYIRQHRVSSFSFAFLWWCFDDLQCFKREAFFFIFLISSFCFSLIHLSLLIFLFSTFSFYLSHILYPFSSFLPLLLAPLRWISYDNGFQNITISAFDPS